MMPVPYCAFSTEIFNRNTYKIHARFLCLNNLIRVKQTMSRNSKISLKIV